MAEKIAKPKPPGFHAEFGWFIWGFIGIGVLWLWSGGYNNESAHNGAYIKPLAPLDSGQTYGNYYAAKPSTEKETLNLPESPATIVRNVESVIADFIARRKEAEIIHKTSTLSQSIYFDGTAGAKSKDVSSEYIRIVASGLMKNPINISGFGLEGTYFDGSVTIPKATNNQDIVIYPSDRAIISTGASPIAGIAGSFRVNACSSYLSGANRLVPALRTSPYTGFSTYEDCVNTHKRDANFDSREWRIFLGQKIELWRNSSEIIRLVDLNGKVIDALTY